MTKKIFYVLLCLFALSLPLNIRSSQKIRHDKSMPLSRWLTAAHAIASTTYKTVRRKIIETYIKRAPLKPFLSLIEMDYGSKDLKKERLQARKMVWENYFHTFQKVYKIPTIKLISELMSHRNSLFLNHGREPIRSNTITRKKIQFMEEYCKKIGIDPSNIDFIDDPRIFGRAETIFNPLHFHKKNEIIYFDLARLEDDIIFKWNFFHELGHTIANHSAIILRLKMLGKSLTKQTRRLIEFMGDALIGLIDPEAARVNLQYAIDAIDFFGRNTQYYLSQKNRFVLQADIALLHGITIQECLGDQTKYKKLLEIYKNADTNFFTQEDSYAMPRFLPEILPDFLEKQGIK